MFLRHHLESLVQPQELHPSHSFSAPLASKWRARSPYNTIPLRPKYWPPILSIFSVPPLAQAQPRAAVASSSVPTHFGSTLLVLLPPLEQTTWIAPRPNNHTATCLPARDCPYPPPHLPPKFAVRERLQPAVCLSILPCMPANRPTFSLPSCFFIQPRYASLPTLFLSATWGPRLRLSLLS